MNFYPVTVVDNFLNNPDEVRAFALRQKYTFCHEVKDIDYVFPGSRTTDLFDLDKNCMQKSARNLYLSSTTRSMT
jgi:hypothetical protein